MIEGITLMQGISARMPLPVASEGGGGEHER